MKAYALYGIGNLRYEDRPLPELKPGWALVRVLAAGICSSDIPRIFTKGTYHFPTIPGHEFSGQVEAVADEENRGWIGRRVGVFPLIPCKQCPSCLQERYETCEHYDYIGSRRDGGFAEYVAVPVWNLIPLPDAVSDVQAALLEPAAVALHAVKRAGDLHGSRVCVVGTGAIGLLAGQWARIRGAAQVVVQGRSEAKRELVLRCDLEYAVKAEQTDFDCVIEAVGTEDALEESLMLAAPGGRVVLMGNPSGDRTLSQDLYWRILRKQLTLIGTWNSSYGGKESDWEAAVHEMKSGDLRIEPLVTHTLQSGELLTGLEMMRDRTEPYCKVLIQS